ncbi:MAG TPA: GNAT family N-acetyltransferase [Anaerolineales bacterium]|nr:GNAT family N-acetyltransferase [Anaerolineales bacterium]
MNEILVDFTATELVKKSIKTNWENYHYCLGCAPNVELSISRYLTWLVTNMPDHFMNLVVCTELPREGADKIIDHALNHFKSLNIKKLSWLAEEGVKASTLKKYLEARGLTFRESFAAEMAIDLTELCKTSQTKEKFEIIHVDDNETLKKWVHVATTGFGMYPEVEDIWYDFFAETVFNNPFRTYLALLNGKPVGTSQLFTSGGVAGIYNVSSIPEARGQGIGTAITLAPLLEARKRGYRVGVLQASSVGYNVYRKIGFNDFGKLSVFLWENGTNT